MLFAVTRLQSHGVPWQVVCLSYRIHLLAGQGGEKSRSNGFWFSGDNMMFCPVLAAGKPAT
jgi:hypothetical protein